MVVEWENAIYFSNIHGETCLFDLESGKWHILPACLNKGGGGWQAEIIRIIN